MPKAYTNTAADENCHPDEGPSEHNDACISKDVGPIKFI